VGPVGNDNWRDAADTLGASMIDTAYNHYSEHIDNGFANFKSILTDAGEPGKEQGAGVYGHILSQAGAQLLGPLGQVVAAHAALYDVAQWASGHAQGKSEVAGNVAGVHVGVHMSNFLSGVTPRDKERLKNSLRSELCQ